MLRRHNWVFAPTQTYRKPSSVMLVRRSAKTSFGPSDVTLTISGTAHVTIEGHSGNTIVTGAIDLTVGACTDAQCPVHISRVELRLAIGINFRVDDETGSVTLRNDALLHGEVNGDGTGFHLAGSFSRDEVSAQFDLSGTPSSYRPIAGFTPNGGTIECNSANGANVTLHSTASDPDNDLRGTVWSIDNDAGVSGSDLTTFLSIGTHSIAQNVFDSRAATAFAGATIEVHDTTAPVLVTQPDQVVVGCADDGVAVVVTAPTSNDLCGSVSVSATITDINGTPTAVPYASDYKFRQGRTTLRFEASDASGNRSTVEQHVLVERGAACCPAGLIVVHGTNASEIITGGNGGQCIDALAGNDHVDPGNSGDFVFAGAGADVVLASNSGDTIYGGSDNDQLTGGNGPDVLWGGPGDDVLVGGNGADILRGGAGKDTMDGGNGADRFIIAAACEAVPGEIIRGGNGVDTVESPLTRAELEARGVILEDIENVVVVPVLSSSECQ